MNPTLLDLHRVTIPYYTEDGTPMVKIPSHVLLSGLENQKEFVIGQFYRCSAPSRGQIQAVVTRIWGRKCRIFSRKLGESSYLFHISDESTRKWVLQRGLWHVDDYLMFLSTWTTVATISLPEITTVPVWLTLKNIPNHLYSIKGIKWIASGLGEPMLTEKPWLDPTHMEKAKILVEVKLDKPFPLRIALRDISDVVTLVDVIYSWLPSNCRLCGQLGHKAIRCLRQSASTPCDPAPKETVITTKFVPSFAYVSALPSTTATISEIDTTKDTNPIITAFITSPLLQVVGLPPTVIGSRIWVKKMTNTTTSTPAALISTRTTHHSDQEIITAAIPTTPDFGRRADPMDLMTLSGKRILRDRPVKPSTKAKEMLQLHVEIAVVAKTITQKNLY